MRLMNLLRGRASLVTVALVLLCLALVTIATWRTLAVQPRWAGTAKNSEADAKREFQERLRKGVGRIQFTSAGDSSEQARASVDSTDGFIFERSNLKMSDETKKRLAKAEENTLKGKNPRLSLDDLTDMLTDTIVERVKNFTDKEIDEAANLFQTTPMGEVISRANGKWGPISKEEFVQQMKSAREWGQRGDAALRQVIRPLMEEEVHVRADNLSEALPEQFGRIKSDGVTPLQATLIGYSVAADDPLDGSASDTTQQVVRHRMETKQVKSGKPNSHKPYGVNGALFSSPVHLLFNKAATRTLLARYEGGKK